MSGSGVGEKNCGLRHEANYVIAFEGRGKSDEAQDQLKSKSYRALFFPRRLSEPTNSSYVLFAPNIDWFVHCAVQIFLPRVQKMSFSSNI